MRFERPYFHIPTRVKRRYRGRKDLLQRLEEKQKQLLKAHSKTNWWEDLCQRGDDVGHGVRKFRHGPYRILAVVEPEWQCLWVYDIYHKDKERKVDDNLRREIQEARKDWGIKEELKQVWLQQQEDIKQKSRRKPLSPEDREWLAFPDQFLTKESYLILESPDWYEKVVRKSRDWLEELHSHLKELLKDVKAFQSRKRGTYPEDRRGGMQILYRWFPVWLPNHAKETWVLYLQDISSDSPKGDNFFAEFFDNWEEVAKRARRAYPAMVLENKDLWIITVKDLPTHEGITATLALSEEEIEILTQPSPRPLFINGRAGSGKTTLLYWLFVEYLFQALDWKRKHEKPFRVRFLTYSERLRDAARDQINSLFGVHPITKVLEEEGVLSPEEKRGISESILTFREFLLKEMKGALEPQKFNRENYIDFSRFREEYLNSPIHRSTKRRFSPEQAWFAIRALILGYDADLEMDPDWYAEIFGRRDEKIFSQEDFRTLYHEIYLQWYRKHRERGWWNEVDLAREFIRLLRKQQPEQSLKDLGFHLLMVDEAQDFTRVEFQLLFRLLYWSRFTLTQQDWEQVPLILAGDPLQTINPTGFRWAYVKDLFNRALDDPEIPPLSLEIKSLKKNYRSTQSLVCLSNAVLAWRRRLFRQRGEERELYQDAWYAQERPLRPTLYPFNPQDFARHISNKKFVVIGPWFSGREDDETYKTWSALKPHEILSPEEAKGLEYDRVILAGFGRAWREVFQSKDELKKRLFWARLYVALTRARKDIAIVEPPQGREFWHIHFIHPEKDPQESKDFPEECVSPFLDEAQSATEFALKEESWLSLARNMYERARRERNANWFAQAAKYFGNALKYREVSNEERLVVEEEKAISQFYAALLKDNLRKALEVLKNGSSARLFNFRAKKTKPRHKTLLRDLTLEAWRQEQWDLVQNVAELHRGSLLQTFLERISTFMGDPSLKRALDLLDELKGWPPIPLFAIKPHDDHRSEEVLRKVILQWLQFLKQNLPSMSKEQKRDLAQGFTFLAQEDTLITEILGQKGIKEQANLLFEIGRATQTRYLLRKACDLWEQIQSTGSREYAYACALLSNHHSFEALNWWVKAGEYEQALHVYQFLAPLPPCSDDLWKDSGKRSNLVRLWQEYASTWKIQEVIHWLDCFWEVSRQEALQLWRKVRKHYAQAKEPYDWLERRIKRGIPYEAWKDIEKALSDDAKKFRSFFIQSVVRHPQRLKRFIDAVRKEETSLDKDEWLLLFEAWGLVLRKAENESRLLEWADLRNSFDIQEQIQEQFQRYLLEWIKNLQEPQSASPLWHLYEWLLGEKQPEPALWTLFTDMYRQAREPSQRAFLIEQIYTRRRVWKDIPNIEACAFIKQILTDFEQQRLKPQERLLKQMAVLIERLCTTAQERSRHLQHLSKYVQSEILQNILKERARQWNESQIHFQKWEDIAQIQAQPQDAFPKTLQDDLVLMLHNRKAAFDHIQEWYSKASLQARKSMIEMLLREAQYIKKIPPHVREWLREIVREPSLPRTTKNTLRKRFRLK